MEEMLQLAQSGRVDRQSAMLLKRSRIDMFRRSAAAGTFQLDGAFLMVSFAIAVLFSVSLLG